VLGSHGSRLLPEDSFTTTHASRHCYMLQIGEPGEPPQPSCLLDVPVSSTDLISYMAQQCSTGYYGPVCSLCVTSPPQRYGRTGTLQCQPCRSTAAIVCAYIGSGVLVLAFLTYTVQVTLKENEEDPHNRQSTVQASELLKVSCCCCCSAAVALCWFCLVCCHDQIPCPARLFSKLGQQAVI